MFGAATTATLLPLLAATQLDAGPGWMGVLAAASWSPWLILGLPAGALADRWPSRTTMIASDLIAASAAATVPLLWATGTLSLPALVAVAFVIGSCAVVFRAALPRLVTRVVDAEQLGTANSMLYATGNVAQVFLDDHGWSATLHGIRGALRGGGHLVFETRRPERRAWEEWAVETGPVIRNIPGVGEVEQRREVTRVALPYVSFRYTYRFASDGLEAWSESTLRFRSRAEVEETLATNGFTTLGVRDAPDSPGREYVFVAQRTH